LRIARHFKTGSIAFDSSFRGPAERLKSGIRLDVARGVNAATKRILKNELRELEADGSIVRTVYAHVPPEIE